MSEKVVISDIELILSEPANVDMQWVGNEDLINELKAAWMVVDDMDLPLTPRILGKPGVGKTTLAYATGKRLRRPVYIFQATMDTRPEDLLISPVISENNKIAYIASSLVSAMIKGGVCLLDEANRMSEKSWASLAPLMDKRRYIDSIIVGLRIYAHPEFRLCVTMNSDSSTFELPEYIESRLSPRIIVEFPNRTDELAILNYNLPFGSEEILNYCVDFLQNSHKHDEYTVRDGIFIVRYYIKTRALNGKDQNKLNKKEFKNAILHILDEGAIMYCPDEYEEFLKKQKEEFISFDFFGSKDDDDD